MSRVRFSASRVLCGAFCGITKSPTRQITHSPNHLVGVAEGGGVSVSSPELPPLPFGIGLNSSNFALSLAKHAFANFLTLKISSLSVSAASSRATVAALRSFS